MTDKPERESNGAANVEEQLNLKSFIAGSDGKKKRRVKRSKFRRYTPHALVGVVILGTLRIIFSNVALWPTPLQWHVILGIIGYQALMGHGTLLIHTMAHKDLYWFPNTSKKTLHWLTTGSGAACALAGLYCIYSDKEKSGHQHFNSIHGILGLTSLILTAVSLLNGVIFYYWQELGIGKGNIKFLHISTGLLTFVVANACLAYGYDKNTFYAWTSARSAYVLIAVCGLSVAYFSLSPGRIILNKFKINEHDKQK